MDFKEIDKEIYNELASLNQAMRFWRAINASFTEAPCAHQSHLYLLNWMKEMFIFFILVKATAITNDEDPDGVTFGKWLNSGEPKDKIKWDDARENYKELRKSDAHKSMKRIRTVFHAHNLNSGGELENLPSRTYRDLFGIIESLQKIYDVAAESGMCASTNWNLPMKIHIEESVQKFMKAAEGVTHKERMHKNLIEMDDAKKAANPELY